MLSVYVQYGKTINDRINPPPPGPAADINSYPPLYYPSQALITRNINHKQNFELTLYWFQP